MGSSIHLKQGKTRQDKSKTKQGKKTRHDKTKMTRQVKTRQDKARQDKTRQDKAGRDKTTKRVRWIFRPSKLTDRARERQGSRSLATSFTTRGATRAGAARLEEEKN